MQRHELAPEFQPRNLATRGPLHPLDQLDPATTAHLVVDMQNGFLRPGALLEVPEARAVVPQINAISAALRAAGGMVAFTRFAWKPDEARSANVIPCGLPISWNHRQSIPERTAQFLHQ